MQHDSQASNLLHATVKLAKKSLRVHERCGQINAPACAAEFLSVLQLGSVRVCSLLDLLQELRFLAVKQLTQRCHASFCGPGESYRIFLQATLEELNREQTLRFSAVVLAVPDAAAAAAAAVPTTEAADTAAVIVPTNTCACKCADRLHHHLACWVHHRRPADETPTLLSDPNTVWLGVCSNTIHRRCTGI
jgi:hypothetical protein